MDKTRVSVIMPVYNGAKYLGHQLDSITSMLGDNDEIVISYDQSTDNTLEIIRSYEQRDQRIKVFINEGERGVWQNSMNALKHARGEFIFPSDQDDEWINDKIEVVVSEFKDPNVLAVMHDGYVCDAEMNIVGDTIQKRENTSDSWVRNYIKSTIAGCCLAFRSGLSQVLLETPVTPDAADLWNVICAIILGKFKIITPVLIKHRIHESNFTPKFKRKLSTKIYSRMTMGCDILWLFIHKKKYKSICMAN